MIVPDQIARAVRRYSENIAAIGGEERRTFREIDERSNRLAHALFGMGLRKGDRVASLIENSVRCIEVDFALAKAGLVRVSLNPRSTANEAQFILADSDARVLIFGSGYKSVVSDISVRESEVERWLSIREGDEASPSGRTTSDYEEVLASASPARRRSRHRARGPVLPVLYFGHDRASRKA